MSRVISIIIPFYNAEKTIETTIKSIIKQDVNSNVEIILIDDGSIDNSKDIVKRYKNLYKNIKLIEIKNKGVSYARNIGIDSSNGDYIMFLDADDTFDLNLFNWFNNLIDYNWDLLIFDYINDYTGEIHKKAKKVDNFRILDKIECQNMAVGIKEIDGIKTRFNTVWGKVFKKKFLDDNNIRFIEGLKVGEDCLFAYTAYQHSSIIHYYSFRGYYYYKNINSTIHKPHKDMVLIDSKWQLEFESIISKYSNSRNNDLYINFSLGKGIINICNLYIGHRNSNLSFKEKKKMLEEVVNSEPYNKCNYNIIERYFKRENLLLIKLIKYKMFNSIIAIFSLKNNILNFNAWLNKKVKV